MDLLNTLSNLYCSKIKTDHYSIEKPIKEFNKVILKAAKESIPRGAHRNYKPYWSEELQELEDSDNEARENAEQNPSQENNIHLKATEAKYRRTHILQARIRWREKTQSLNLDKDGHKLWSLAKSMNNEVNHSSPVKIEEKIELIASK